MAKPQVLTPAPGSRIVKDEIDTALFGQPPEVLKGLMREGITSFDTLVLTDIKEKNGSLLNNLEFPFYFFLFIAKGLAEHRKINLVGDKESISQALRLLRFTLFGPTRNELDQWKTPEDLKDEWLAVSEHLALKDDKGNNYKLISIPRDPDAEPIQTLYPGENIDQMLVFQKPVSSYKQLRLTLPGGAFGAEENAYFRIKKNFVVDAEVDPKHIKAPPAKKTSKPKEALKKTPADDPPEEKTPRKKTPRKKTPRKKTPRKTPEKTKDPSTEQSLNPYYLQHLSKHPSKHQY